MGVYVRGTVHKGGKSNIREGPGLESKGLKKKGSQEWRGTCLGEGRKVYAPENPSTNTSEKLQD